jgi:hypothetical protein
MLTLPCFSGDGLLASLQCKEEPKMRGIERLRELPAAAWHMKNPRDVSTPRSGNPKDFGLVEALRST